MELKQLNILLAEDDIDDHTFFEDIFKELNESFILNIVKDGEQLINYLSENAEQLPDILFLDLSMPRKNGFECLCEINENEKFKNLSIVILSTSFTQDKNYELGMINSLFKLGASIFIRKPNNHKDLKHVVSLAISLAKENTGLKYILNA